MPFLRSMKTKLTVETVSRDLRWYRQKNHPRKTAAMGVGWVVVASALTVQPEINRLQFIASRHPWTTAGRRLTIHHMTDPAVTSWQQMLSHQSSNTGEMGLQLSLLAQLARKLGRGIGAAGWVGQYLTTHTEQGLKQVRR